MIKAKTLTPLFSTVILALLVTGCFDDGDETYDGPPQVKFSETHIGQGWTETVTMNPDSEEAIDHEVGLSLVSGQSGDDRDVNFTITESGGGEETTAEEGVHFELHTDSPAVIPANESFGEIEIEILTDNFENDQEETLVLELEDSDDLEAAANYSYFTIYMSKDEVSFSAELEGTEDYEDVSGSVDIQGNTADEMFAAESNLSDLAEEETYSWGVFYGDCDSEDGVVGDEGDYPNLETGEDENSASVDTEVDVRLYQDDEIHVQVFDDGFLGDDLVACQELE